MANFTQLTYNGVILDDIRTLDISYKPVLTDDNAIYLYDEVTIRVNAYLNTELSPAEENEKPIETFNRIKKCLTTKGGNVTYISDGVTLLQVVNNADCKGGPFPSALSVKQVSSATWQIEWGFTTYINQCCETLLQLPVLLAHRWTESIQIDQNHYSTITRKGVLHFRFDLLKTSEKHPDEYRKYALMACPLKSGFIRTHSSWNVRSDWLAVEYVIEDKEQYAMPLPLKTPGAAITTVSGTYRVGTEKGAAFTEEVNLSATGNKLAKKSEMYQALSTMAMAILGLKKNNKGLVKIVTGQKVFIHQAFTEHEIFENRVTLHMKNKIPVQTKTKNGVNYPRSAIGRIGGWAGFDMNVPDPGSRGSARLLLVANFIQDPCLFAKANGGAIDTTVPTIRVVPGVIKDIT